jgi:arsenite-transporting ATPase
MGQARALLTDASKTAFFFIALPEALPIAVITRFIGWFHEFGIPVGGVIVNMVMDREALGSQVPEFVLNRLRMQEEHLGTIREKFDGQVRAIVPLFDQEVRGIPMLRQAAAALFAEPA